MNDIDEETDEQIRERIERGSKLFYLYTNKELVKQSQIKEFEKYGMTEYADSIRKDGPYIGGRKVFEDKKVFLIGLDHGWSMGQWLVRFLDNAKKAKNREDRLFAIQNALRLRRSLTLYGLSLG
jgi:hypothetical protein